MSMFMAKMYIPGLLALLFVAGCSIQLPTEEGIPVFPKLAKSDVPVQMESYFEVEAGDIATYELRNCSRLHLRFRQDRAYEETDIRLIAQSEGYLRRSRSSANPQVTLPPPAEGCEYVEVSIENPSDQTLYGELRVRSEVPAELGIEFVPNAADCEDCEDPAGGLREALTDAIRSARRTVDFALYGVNDPQILDALCEAAEHGARVRVLTDDFSEDPEDSRGYFESIFGDAGLSSCGADVVAVRSSGLMHHKFILVDSGDADELLITGSTNLTTAGLEQNHNHMTFLRGFPDLSAAYVAEFEQLFERCEGNANDCSECTPACVLNASEEGPWREHGAEVNVYFAPSDDALEAIRGKVFRERVDAPDEDCGDPSSDCACRPSGDGWACDYCAMGDDGYGALENASNRIVMTVFAATDICLALGIARAHERGANVLGIWDRVQSASAYSRDDFLCAAGIPTYRSQWGDGAAFVLNHNKLLVIDDLVVDGSMNLSDNGTRINNENTLLIQQREFADEVAAYIRQEVALLEANGASPSQTHECLCGDGVDNDGDGLWDETDPDCDSPDAS